VPNPSALHRRTDRRDGGTFRDLGGPVDNDKRTELAIVVIAAVVVGMIAVAHPASVPVMGIVVAVVALVLVWLKL
jgi:hypothetical protein